MDPQTQNPTPPTTSSVESKKSIKLPLFLMIGPIVLFIGSFILYALFNFITASAGDSANAIRTVVNILLFFVTVITVLGGPVSFIVGLVLLLNRSSKS